MSTTTQTTITLGGIITGKPAMGLRMSYPRPVLIDGIDTGARVDAETKEMTAARLAQARQAIADRA